jgi:YrbI family 3-deoxy-D-manno-octulosonate 8-phosphate phosphatase
MKKFNVKDGMGMKLLRDAGIKNAIITTDTSDLIKVRSERLKVDHLYLGTWDKDKKMMEICELENILPEEVAFIGDDVNDIDIIHKSGFSASPNDALSDIKNIVDLVLSKNGGEGAFREFADLILKAKNN